jgi:hypothetical protein
MRTLAAGGLPSDRAGRAAGSAALPPARPRPADLELWIAERTLSRPTDTVVSMRTARATARGSLRAMLDQAREDRSERLP